jgi:hypothetical protein
VIKIAPPTLATYRSTERSTWEERRAKLFLGLKVITYGLSLWQTFCINQSEWHSSNSQSESTIKKGNHLTRRRAGKGGWESV